MNDLDARASLSSGRRLEQENRVSLRSQQYLLPTTGSQSPVPTFFGVPASAPQGVGGGRPVSGVAPARAGGRNVYVLHSGMNDPGNVAANGIRQGLLRRGVRPDDIIVMDNPYPSFSQGVSSTVQNWELYKASTDPRSALSQRTYNNLESRLQASGVTAADRIVWVGHSAGGQMGLTLSDVAAHRGNYRFDTVITMGTPVSTNVAPRAVRVRQYISPSDGVLFATNQVTLDNVRVEAFSSNLDSNDQIRVFSGVTHAQWYRDDLVMDRVMEETNPNARPRQPRAWWKRAVAWLMEKCLGMTWETT